MWLLIFKVCLIVFSALATGLSVIFMLFPSLFTRIEEILGMEFGGYTSFAVALEGKINIINDWVGRYRAITGPVLAILAAINTRNAVFL